MPPLPRGTCIACRRDVALRTNRTAREHQALVGKRKCPGTAMRSREEIDRAGDATEAEREVAQKPPVVLLAPVSERAGG